MDQDKKLREAKEWMGARYVFHPAYKSTRKHSTDPNVWYPSRTLKHSGNKK